MKIYVKFATLAASTNKNLVNPLLRSTKSEAKLPFPHNLDALVYMWNLKNRENFPGSL